MKETRNSAGILATKLVERINFKGADVNGMILLA
jgi:hypothetical protein